MFSDSEPPELQPDEHETRERPDSLRRPLRIEVSYSEDKVDHMSRLDWSEVVRVKHNVRARELGIVHPDFEHVLVAEFSAVNPKTDVRCKRPIRRRVSRPESSEAQRPSSGIKPEEATDKALDERDTQSIVRDRKLPVRTLI